MFGYQDLILRLSSTFQNDRLQSYLSQKVYGKSSVLMIIFHWCNNPMIICIHYFVDILSKTMNFICNMQPLLYLSNTWNSIHHVQRHSINTCAYTLATEKAIQTREQSIQSLQELSLKSSRHQPHCKPNQCFKKHQSPTVHLLYTLNAATSFGTLVWMLDNCDTIWDPSAQVQPFIHNFRHARIITSCTSVKTCKVDYTFSLK